MLNKKGLGNPNPQSMIALLIFIITIALILYILFLPPEDRALLLEQNRTALGLPPLKDKITILMTKEPGRLTNIADEEIIHDLPSFSLFTRTDAGVIEEYDSLDPQKSLFEEVKRNITFDIRDPEKTDNIMLSFNAPRHEGELTIKLNGGVIYSRAITTPSPSPISLQKSLLSEQNVLEFSVSGPGIEFWKTNKYNIDNIKITADVTDKSSQDNTQMIYISEQEYDNIESFELSFVADCRTPDVGPLEVYLRKRKIFDSVPDCGDLTKVPVVSGDRLVQGENDLLFVTQKGNYLLYSVEVKLKLKEPIFPTYYFTMNEERYLKVQSNDADVNVTLLFPNSIDRKKGIVVVNDYILEVETYDTDWNRNVNSFLRRGNNAIEIRPKTDKLDIVELNVLLAE